MMNESFFQKLLNSITSSDNYILIMALFVLLMMICVLAFSRVVSKDFRNNQPVYRMYQALCVFYTLFTTGISLFPLLGMFGTVKALLELDLSGDLSMIQGKFFNALTSTAWGIIFSIAFKIIHALFQSQTENLISQVEHKKESGKIS